MSRIRVLDVAKELNLDTKTAILKLQDLGIQVKNHFNALTDIEADKLRSLVRSGKSVAKDGAPKTGSKVVIRRRAAEESPSAANTEPPNVDPAPARVSAPSVAEGPSAEAKTVVEKPVEKAQEPNPVEVKASAVSLKVDSPAPKVEPSVSVENIQAAKPQDASASLKTASAHSNPSLKPETPKIDTKPAAAAAGVPVASTPASAPEPKNTSSAVIVRRAVDVTNAPRPQSYTGGGNSQNSRGQSISGDNYYAQNQNRYGDRPQGGGYGGPRGGAGGDRPQGGGYGGPRGGTGGDRPQGGGYGGPRTGDGRYRSPGTGYAGGSTGQRPPMGGGPRGGGFGAPPPAAVLPTEPVNRRDGREKERDLKRRSLEEENRKSRLGEVKGRRNSDEDILDDLLELDAELDTETTEDGSPVHTTRTVYTPLPNRKKGSFVHNSLKRREEKKHEVANPTKASKKVIRIQDTITVNDIAAELSIKASAVIKELMKLGMLATVNQVLDLDTATVVASNFGYEVQNVAVSIDDILQKGNKTDDKGTESRPPIITVMGHVDHGKTSLLDAIRSTNIASKEAGGITQHIGAYQVKYQERFITFLDTPGHEAFTSMRARGAQLTDIVVLVVAADDGVMPQTVEAISHAKAANVPIIVAINKIDKPSINIQRIERELAQHGVTSEEWGGESIFVKVSAKTREGLDDLLESLVLQADVLDLKCNPKGSASGIVIESRLDKSRGTVATVVVQQGVLKKQDWVVAGQTYGRVKALFNDQGVQVTEASPSVPVEILGLDEVPSAGDTFNVVANDSVAKEAVSFRIQKTKEKELASQQKTTLDNLFAKLNEEAAKGIELPVIVKADTHGSVEAIKGSLKKLDRDKVKTRIIHSAVGGITETDVTLAKTSQALVLGFNVRPDRVAATVAEREHVQISLFGIIYELIDFVQSAMAGRLAPVRTEKVVGHAEVRNLFSVPKIGVISGSFVQDGKIVRNGMVRVVRDGTVIYTGRVGSLRRFKDDAKEVVQGFECGIGVENYNDLKVGDILEVFAIEETAATLD